MYERIIEFYHEAVRLFDEKDYDNAYSYMATAACWCNTYLKYFFDEESDETADIVEIYDWMTTMLARRKVA